MDILMVLTVVNLVAVVALVFVMRAKVEGFNDLFARLHKDLGTMSMDKWTTKSNEFINRTNIQELYDVVMPLIRDDYREDIDLVLKTDYSNLEYRRIEFTAETTHSPLYIPYHEPQSGVQSRKEIKVVCQGRSVFKDDYEFDGRLHYLSLKNITKRASELRELQSKLCCKEESKKKTQKRSSK